MRKLLILALALALVGCAGFLRWETNRGDGDWFYVPFEGGTLRVSSGECGGFDWREMQDFANRAFRDMSEAWPAESFKSDKIFVRGEKLSNRSGYYSTKRNLIVFNCGVERVLRHELFHYYCYNAQLTGCDCYWIDHPAPEGYNLDCTRRVVKTNTSLAVPSVEPSCIVWGVDGIGALVECDE